MKINFLRATVLSSSMILTLSACSGGGGSGGGGSSPSTTAPAVVKSAKMQCGSKDCVTGSSVSTMSAADDAYTYFKTQYDAAKLVVSSVNDAVTNLNNVAYDNDIASCDDIPTTGTVLFGGDTLVLGAGGESFNIGNGMVTTDHSVQITNTSGDKTFISFKCGTTQSIHIVKKSNAGDLYESFYQINTSTNAITLEYGSVLGSNKAYGYFKNDGGDAFTFGLFMNTATGTSPNAIIGGAKDYTSATNMVTPASGMLSFAWTTVAGEDIDSVSVSNNNTLHYRACVTANRTSVVSNSCANQANVSGSNGSEVDFSVSSVANLIGNASTWSTDDVETLTIADPF